MLLARAIGGLAVLHYYSTTINKPIVRPQIPLNFILRWIPVTFIAVAFMATENFVIFKIISFRTRKEMVFRVNLFISTLFCSVFLYLAPAIKTFFILPKVQVKIVKTVNVQAHFEVTVDVNLFTFHLIAPKLSLLKNT
jgi:hypothetical protein